MGLDEAWSPGKNMHALLCMFVTEDTSHGAMGWLKAAVPENTARPHHAATPPASAHPRSTTRTAPRKTNNHATVLYSTRIHMRSAHRWCGHIGEPVRARRDDIMGCTGLDEAWSPGKDMHALKDVSVTEAMSHGPMGWLNSAFLKNTVWRITQPHHRP